MLTGAGCCSRDVPNFGEKHLPRHLGRVWQGGLDRRDCLGESSGTTADSSQLAGPNPVL